jgi:hypothetical protein
MHEPVTRREVGSTPCRADRFTSTCMSGADPEMIKKGGDLLFMQKFLTSINPRGIQRHLPHWHFYIAGEQFWQRHLIRYPVKKLH